MKKIIRVLGLTGLSIVIAFIGFVVFITLADYRPQTEEIIAENINADILSDSIFQFITWNIGYAGLGKDMDFFYDGGQQTRTTKVKLQGNIRFIKQFLSSNDSIDFYLFQEVDLKSRRSYKTNQKDTLQKIFGTPNQFLAYNYRVSFVPVPLSNPLGKVASGLLSIFKYTPQNFIRVSYPGNYTYPKNLFMLDRCFSMHTFKLSNGKKLIVINTHNSAFDDGSLRDMQMSHLKKYILRLYDQGNYVVVGGDWNQYPPNFKSRYLGYLPDITEKYIPVGYPDTLWHWAYDDLIPSNRRVNTPYDKASTKTTTIDFYLLSPNIETIQCETINLEFQHSDHNPVYLRVKLKNM